jgi:ribosomal protein S18 acetylase RimI-like enzyme
VIRRARPDDAPRAAPLIYSSGPAVFDFIFGKPADKNAIALVRDTFPLRGNLFSHRRHHVAAWDGEVVGTMALFTKKDVRNSQPYTAARIVRHYGLQALGVLWRGLRVESELIEPPRTTCLYVAHLGVAPTFQGRGIGTWLLRHAEREARAQGFRRLSLDVSARNPGAQRLYERLGFQVVETRESFDASMPDHHYMERTLY